MNRYRVDVVASYHPDVELLRIFSAVPRERDVSPGIPHIDTRGENWTISEDAQIPPTRRTLTVSYDAEGRHEDEARRFALAIFAQESERAGLPAPETVVANFKE